MDKPLRIGTRESELATWQAGHVAGKLSELEITSELFFVKSEGDIDLATPLYEMGGKGVFTKALDEALLNGEIDLAVHSYKDLPTENTLPLKIAAVLEREDPRDSLVAPGGIDFLNDDTIKAVIATGSNRRRAQWLHRYPGHKMADIRGNVQTRLKKVEKNKWDGAIFAAAGLKRINLEHHIAEYLDWMVPAPAQGAIAVMVRSEDKGVGSKIAPLRHNETEICTAVERELLNTMEAGCSAPVGAFAWIEKGLMILHAVALTLDGSIQYDVELTAPAGKTEGLGIKAAENLLEQGANVIIEDLNRGQK